ncbi:hypothetical protein ACJMK2_040981 [Sinanodonta woodiana]|uniref:Assembly chaperone of rpl4 n=1 Tax=Sinanodonta woodiana TaxID=1069815 RepID=A0ABD3W5W2_SINWO
MGKKKFKKKPGASLVDRRRVLRDASNEIAIEKKGKKNMPYSVDQLLNKAEECIDRFEYEVAQKFCQRALEIEPDNVHALETSGTLLLEVGNMEAAKHCFGRAVEMCPEQGYSKYMNLGQLLEGEHSVQCYQKGIELMVKEKQQQQAEEVAAACGGGQHISDRDISSAYLSIAEIYMTDLCFSENAEDKCKENIEKAIAADTQNPEALQTMSNFMLSKDDKEEARKMIRKSVELWLPPASSKEGAELVGNGPESDEGVTEPNTQLPYDSRKSAAKILIEVEEYDLTSDVLDNLLEENDEDPELWYLHGWTNYLRGDDYKGNARYYLKKTKKVYVKSKCQDNELMKHVEELLQELGPGDEEDVDSESEDALVGEAGDLEQEIQSDDEDMEH